MMWKRTKPLEQTKNYSASSIEQEQKARTRMRRRAQIQRAKKRSK